MYTYMRTYYPAVMWPKLQLQQEKPHWLRLDFDHMGESSDEAEGEDDNVDKEVSQVKVVDDQLIVPMPLR